jgi:hypothetical protein
MKLTLARPMISARCTDYHGENRRAAFARWTLDFAKLPSAVESLTKRVATIQLTGDYAAAAQLITSYVKPVVKGKKYEYVGKIKVPLTTMKAAFKKANIKSVALSYKVIGL